MASAKFFPPAGRVAKIRKKSGAHAVALTAVFILSAVLVGLISVFLPWWLMLALAAGVIYPILLLNMPWTGIFVYFIALELSLDLKMSDVLTGVTFLLFGIQFIFSNRKIGLPRRDLQLFLTFMSLVLVSVLLALTFFHNTIPFIYRDARAFMYWLWLPLLFWLAGSRPDGDRNLARVLIAIACAVAVLALVQYVFGVQLIREGRVGSLETGGSVDIDTTRVQMPGFTFVLVGLSWAVVSIVKGGKRIFYGIPLAFLFTAALYVNFGRALWTWSVLAVVVCGAVMGFKRAMIIIGTLGVLGISVGAGLYLSKPVIIDNIVHRFGSVADEGGSKSSFGWRRLENQAAAEHIVQSPLVGIGLGGEYRSWVPDIRQFSEHTRYIHNAYVFMAVKLGLPAAVLLVVMLLRIWWRSLRLRHAPGPREDTLWVAIVGSFLSILAISTTQPELVSTHTIFLLCLMLAKLLHVAGGMVPNSPILRSDLAAR